MDINARYLPEQLETSAILTMAVPPARAPDQRPSNNQRCPNAGLVDRALGARGIKRAFTPGA